MGDEQNERCTRCTKCGKEEKRSLIVVLKIAFHKLGSASSQVRARNVHWFCPECCGQSNEWNLKVRRKTKTSPGVDVACDTCHGLFHRDEIMVSKAIFYPLGNAQNTMRARTRSWQCYRILPDGITLDPECCIAKDQVYNLEAYRATPGWRETEERDPSEIEGGVE